MAIWAIADLHLSFGIKGKEMGVFGEQWERHHEKIAAHWTSMISPDDLVLIAGDTSWAKKLEEALPDLEWIDSLPGTKVLLRGNHDYWWSSLAKMEKVLPESLHLIQNNSFMWKNYEIGGARLWDSDFTFDGYIDYRESPDAHISPREINHEENAKIFKREIGRLELSLNSFRDTESTKIVMTHYPPIDADLNPSPVSELLEEYHISLCVFGHLHNVKPNALPFGVRNGVNYILTSCDYLDFIPIEVIPNLV